MEEKTKHHESLEGSYHWRHRCCYSKICESHGAWNNEFLLKEKVSRCCASGFMPVPIKEILKDSGDIGNKKDVGRWVTIRYWRNSRADRPHTRGINKTRLDEDEGFWTSARQGGRICRRSSPKKQTHIRPSGRRVPVILDCFWLLLGYDSGFPGSACGKEPACQCRRPRSHRLIPGSGRSPGEENSYRLQYSCLGNPMDRGAWWTIVQVVIKSRTWLRDYAQRHEHGSSMIWALQLNKANGGRRLGTK